MTKRFLALTLCAVMIVCSMGLPVFATEDKPIPFADDSSFASAMLMSEDSDKPITWADYADTSWYKETDETTGEAITEFTLNTAEQLAGLAKLVDEWPVYNEEEDGYLAFENVTIKLGANIDLKNILFNPIGSYRSDHAFCGKFDGNGKTISNLSQNTWELNNGYYYTDLGLGLFGLVYNAEIRDLTIDGAEISGESAICGTVAACAYGDCTFENITISNAKVSDYQYYAGGIVGWASGDQKYINCNVAESTTVAAQWGDFDNSTGGVIGGCGGSATILMKDCDIACRIDAYNDVTSTYQWYAYRRCGMLIGNTGKTETIDGTTVAAAPQLTAENCTVTYGAWANYKYCEFAGTSWPYVRVQEGISNSAYSNPRYGHPTDANGKEVVDDDHAHNDGEDCMMLCVFNQLYGGGQGVYGAPEHEGVSINDSLAKLGRAVAAIYEPSVMARSGELVYVDSFETLEEALAALEENQTLVLLKDITITEDWDCRYNGAKITVPVTIDGNGKTLKFTGAVNDKNWNTIFRFEADATVKNLTIDVSEATGIDRGISSKYSITVDNCTLIGNGTSAKRAIIFGEGAGADIGNVTATITNSNFSDWRLGVSDNQSGKDANSVEISGNTFNNASVLVSASDSITFTGNTLTDSYASLSSYTTDNDDIEITATGNTLTSTTEDSDTNIYVYEVGPNVAIDNGVTTYAAQYNDKYFWSFEGAVAAAEEAIAADSNAERVVTILNDVSATDDDTYYRIPQAPVGDQVTVIFDFNGGTNADNYISESFVFNLGASITAPTGLTKDGYIFTGWDKTVDTTAAANVTYTAQWMSYDDYKFKAVLTPVGGVKVADNEIKIDPQGNFIVEVSIEDAINNMPWNVTEVTVSYNTDLFKWNKINDTVTEPELGTLVFKVYGADKVSGKVAKQLSFTAKENTDKNKTYEGEFKVTKATVDTGWAANTINATLVDDANKGTAKVYIYYTFDVTVGDGVDAPYTADTITDYEGTIKNYDPEYNYDIIVDMDGNEDYDVDYNEATGEFVIDNSDIVGDFTIDAVRTGIKGIETDDVELYEYVAGKYVLVLLNADSSRTYAYNSALMYKTPQYDTVEGKKIHYGYLVKGDGFAADVNGSLNTDANKALALSKISLASGTNPSIAHIDTIGDVNGTGTVDVNDIQAVWNAYNVDSNDAPKVNENMALYLRADVVRDKKVNVTDLNAVVEMYDKGITGVQTVLATCDTNGTTYSIDGIVTAETIPAIGHNYVSAGFEGTGTAMAYVETCTNCGGTTNLPLSDIFTTLKVSNGQVWGTADVDTAEKLMIINKLDAAGKLCHGEGISATININADIDLAGYEWRAMNGQFITINGNDHTISNITATEGVSGKGGFISYGGGCRINNLTIENITAEGCQVGAFIGAGEGGSLTNCTLKGNVNLAWKQNYTSDYVEEYGAIGILVGCHANGGSYTVTINENAIINVDDSDFHTLIDTVGYADTYAPYIQYTMGTSLTYDITDNR